MITLSILIVLALICALVGVLMGLFSLIGLLASLLVGVLVGALAGHIANRFMGTQTSTGRNIVLGILGSFVGEFLFGLIGIHATGSISSFVISASASGWITDCSTIVDRFSLVVCLCSPLRESFFIFSPLTVISRSDIIHP